MPSTELRVASEEPTATAPSSSAVREEPLSDMLPKWSAAAAPAEVGRRVRGT